MKGKNWVFIVFDNKSLRATKLIQALIEIYLVEVAIEVVSVVDWSMDCSFHICWEVNGGLHHSRHARPRQPVTWHGILVQCWISWYYSYKMDWNQYKSLLNFFSFKLWSKILWLKVITYQQKWPKPKNATW